MWNEFLPISIPIAAGEVSSFCDMACSLSSVPPASIHCWQGNPHHPERFWNHLGRAYFCAERYAEAAEAFSRITRPDHTHHAFLAATFAQMGNAVAAAAHAAEVLKREPKFSVAVYLATQHYKLEVDRQRHEAGLPKAGLPV